MMNEVSWPEESVISPVERLAEMRLVSLHMPAPGLSPREFVRQAAGQERFFWQDAQVESGRSPLTFAAFGVAANLFAWGENRFRAIRAQAEALFSGALLLSGDQPLAAPRLFGGFAFRHDFTPDNTWSIYNPAHFILPHYQLVQVGRTAWLTINALLPPDEDPQALRPQLEEALAARLALAREQGSRGAGGQGSGAPGALSAEGKLVSVNYPLSPDEWAGQIGAAQRAMAAGTLEKVVLSRVCELRFAANVDVDGALDYLQTHYADCYRFLFEPRPFHAFYGATPELLVGVNGRSLATMALAGSIARGRSRTEDDLLALELQQSAKDQHEHALVVASLRRRLLPLTQTLSIPEKPSIYRLHNIQHLYTPVNGRLLYPDGVLPLVETLHPTPALGGSPRAAAMQFIQETEPVPRGWYAAPVGIIDMNLDGKFAVAIRSAVAQDRRVWLYAGAGIVADSDPQKEWDETELKFRPMLDALGVESV